MDGLDGGFVGIGRKGSIDQERCEGRGEAGLEGGLLVSRVWRSDY